VAAHAKWAGFFTSAVTGFVVKPAAFLASVHHYIVSCVAYMPHKRLYSGKHMLQIQQVCVCVCTRMCVCFCVCMYICTLVRYMSVHYYIINIPLC
jgi:hypothetical protein